MPRQRIASELDRQPSSAELREARLSHALLHVTGPASRDSPKSAVRLDWQIPDRTRVTSPILMWTGQPHRRTLDRIGPMPHVGLHRSRAAYLLASGVQLAQPGCCARLGSPRGGRTSDYGAN